jgi:hypothetical protein
MNIFVVPNTDHPLYGKQASLQTKQSTRGRNQGQGSKEDRELI